MKEWYFKTCALVLLSYLLSSILTLPSIYFSPSLFLSLTHTYTQCRERWYNHLDPSIKRTAWSSEEDRFIITLQHQFGNKWADFALKIPGRTDNAIKNRWNSTLNRILKRIVAECEANGVPPPSTAEDKIALIQVQINF